MPDLSLLDLTMLDGSLASIKRSMLAASLLIEDASGFSAPILPGDELWSYRVPGTSDFGQVLLRGGKVVEVGPATHADLPSAVASLPPAPPVSPPANLVQSLPEEQEPSDEK